MYISFKELIWLMAPIGVQVKYSYQQKGELGNISKKYSGINQEKRGNDKQIRPQYDYVVQK